MTTNQTLFQTTTIRPGLLVSLSCRVRGGVRYDKQDLEREHAAEDGTTRARWETTRVITDADEYERANKVRSQARSVIARVCCDTPLGLLCPMGKEDDLANAITLARGLANEFNEQARYSNVQVYMLTGRISDNDVEAMRAINSEVRDLLTAMEAGVRAADPKAIRDAADRARAMSGVLSADVEAKVGKAIESVRKIARELVRATQAGETAASVVDKVNLDALESARFAVLDMGDTMEVTDRAVEAPAAPAAPAIDLSPIEAPAPALVPASAPAFEL